MLYFAYGSNMNQERMTERGINFTSRKFSILKNYKLVFNKKAKSGDFTFANVESSENDFVEGALYEFPNNEIEKLDKYEGFPEHYYKTTITIIDTDGNSNDAIIYIAQENKIVNGFYPKKEYLNHILKGKDILSNAYFENLKKTETVD